MDWIERLNKAMNYIEEHLTDEIDYGQLGRIACCSAYHFQRMSKIVDVAGNYGYQSPTAFNRAFQAIHGVAPSALKNGSVPVKSFPPISFNNFSESSALILYDFQTLSQKNHPLFSTKHLTNRSKFALLPIDLLLFLSTGGDFFVTFQSWRTCRLSGYFCIQFP